VRIPAVLILNVLVLSEMEGQLQVTLMICRNTRFSSLLDNFIYGAENFSCFWCQKDCGMETCSIL
jgi:hypothetical protein